MGLGQKRPSATPNGNTITVQEARGSVETTAVVSERGHVMRTSESRTNLDAEDVGAEHAMVVTGHSVKMAIEYQSIETVCYVHLPVPNNPAAIKAGFKRAWALVESELEGRALWAKETIDAVVSVKRDTEARR